MRLSATFSALMVLAWAVIAHADDLPMLKDGLWESHTSQIIGASGKKVQTTTKMCQSAALEKSVRETTADIRQKNQCTVTVSHPTAGTFISENHCEKGVLAGTVSRTTAVYSGDTAFHTEMHTTRAGTENVTIIDSKYLGSCPADMKPGDVVMDNGKTINMNGN